MSVDTSGLDEHCAGLSREHVESLCTFRMEANMLRAGTGQEAIDVDEAIQYLKASQFISGKAIDIYKNYQKNRENYQLDHLRPHREPLCTSIGARKMEVVGTRDSEGSPIVLFTLCRHEASKSDHKTDMQLLFYTLDQTAESEAAQENGIVFIMDMRDSLTNDIRFTNSVLSVLKDGYPLHIKMVYLVNNNRMTKLITAIQRVTKTDLSKFKIVNISELGTHFLPEQLPLSLGGTYKPISPLHQQRKGKVLSNDDHSVPSHKPVVSQLPGRRGSGGNKDTGKVSSSVSNGGRSVNKLLEVFESSHDHHSAAKPVPPPQSSKPHPQLSMKSSGSSQSKFPAFLKPSSSSQSKPHFPSSSKPTPPKKTPLSELQHLQQIPTKKAKSSGVHSNEGDSGGKAKIPLLPPSSGRGLNEPSITSSKVAERNVGGNSSLSVVSTHKSINTPPNQASGEGGILKMIQNFQKTADPGKQLPPSGRKLVKSKESRDDLSTSFGVKKSVQDSQKKADSAERKRANSADKVSSMPTPFVGSKIDSVASGSPRKLKMLHSLSENKQEPSAEALYSQPVPRAQRKNKAYIIIGGGSIDSSSSKAIDTTPHTKTVPQLVGQKLAYENVDFLPNKEITSPSHVNSPSHIKPLQDLEYENYEFQSNRDSDVYENIGIGFAGDGRDISGDLPPLPLSRDRPEAPGKLSYENVELKKPPSKGRALADSEVEEDDEVLFGKEGPPGMEESIYENFGPDKGNRLMTAEELASHVEKLGKKGIYTEYFKVRNEPITGPHKACRLPCNTSKNRYKDVICYDESRVQLKSHPGKEGSDYIHANYVDGFKNPNGFILTQGPKDKTVADFLRMIWEKQVNVIVMVTKCIELGKRKCAQYWPEDDNGTSKHGHYTVAVKKVEDHEGYDVRSLQIGYKGSERTLTHFLFLAWPDYGIPTSGSSILRLIFAVREAQAKAIQGSSGGNHPIVVHCSAGVGRSGAFCSIDNCIFELDELGKVNYQGMVRKMRKQRAYAVQTDEQYEFGYRTLLEYVNNGKSYKK